MMRPYSLFKATFLFIVNPETLVQIGFFSFVFSLISSYLTYRLTKPKQDADINKTETDIVETYNEILEKQRGEIREVYKSIGEWMKSYEDAKRALMAAESDFAKAERELRDCGQDMAAYIECVSRVILLVEDLETKLRGAGAFGHVELEFNQIKRHLRHI
jgi:hypothetical protein